MSKNRSATPEPETIQHESQTQAQPEPCTDHLSEVFEGEELEQAKALRKAGWLRPDPMAPYFNLPETVEGRAEFKNEIGQTENASPTRRYSVSDAWRIHCLQAQTRKRRQAEQAQRNAQK